MEDICPDLEKYIVSNSMQEPELLKALARETHLKTLNPRMLSSAYQGRLLSMIAQLIRPTNILEIGTFTGYSALSLAEGISKEGKLITIDRNEEFAYISQKYFRASKHAYQIHQIFGDARKEITTLTDIFDLVFIDADKENYPHYFDLILPKMRKGGCVISDNVLWYGKVAKEISLGDKKTRALAFYNEKLRCDPRVDTLILPIRDGLSITRVK